MAILTQSFEGGTNGTEISSGNTTGGGSAISSIKTGAATVAFTTTGGEVIAGSVSCKCTGPSGAAGYANWSGSGQAGGFYAKHRLTTKSAQTAIQIIRSSANRKMAQVEISAAGRLIASHTTGSVYTTPNALVLPGVYFIDMAVDSGTTASNGSIKFAVYDSSGNLAGGMTAPVEFTGIDAGAGESITYFQVGKCNASTDSSSYIIDDLRAVTGTYGFAAPPTSIATVRPTTLVDNDGAWASYGGAASINAALSDSSDATGIRSVESPSSAEVVVGFGGELSTGDVTVKVKARYDGAPGTIILQLLNASNTVIATGTAQAVTNTLATYQLTLTGGQNSALTGSSARTGLRLKITGSAT